MNTAASWILGRELEDVPELLKSAVISLREVIEKEEITTLYFWYQHNCDEAKEIQNELNTVVATGNALLSRFYPEKQINIIGLEIGNNTLEKWYNNTTNKIIVNDDIEIDLPFGGYEIIREHWSAYQAYISGRKLYELYTTYNDDLFSANPQRFLGIGKKTNIINLGIKDSAKNDADNFWAYNNGITALVHEYDCSIPGKLKITGISIINGAQRQEQLKFLCRRGSRILLLAAVSNCLEIILQQRITSANKLRFDNNMDFNSCKQWWKICIDTALSFYEQLVPALSAGGLDSKTKTESAIKQFGALMHAVVPAIKPQLRELKMHTLLS